MRNGLLVGSLAVTALMLVAAWAAPARAQAPSASAASAQAPSAEQRLSAIVRIKTYINPDARTGGNLGRQREGNGIVIDSSGLILTIGYLMVEAHTASVSTHDGHTWPADIVGYDHETGFGLLRAVVPLKVRPLPLGKSANLKARDPVVIASFGGPDMAAPAVVVTRRAFAGSWEYLLDDAIFTTPPRPAWAGAALIDRDGRLVGVGSLFIGDVTGAGDGVPGNMFVPIDLLPPILGDLLANGRAAARPKPWLGVNTEQVGDRLIVSRVTEGGPAAKAGVERGDWIHGVGGEKTATLDELYRTIWKRGEAGVVVPLDIVRGDRRRRFDVKSMDRMDHLKLKSTF
jgi:S1-C subfamily serine protease